MSKQDGLILTDLANEAMHAHTDCLIEIKTLQAKTYIAEELKV